MATEVRNKRKRNAEDNLVRSYLGKIVKSYESGITGDAVNMMQRITMGVLADLAGIVNHHLAPARSQKTISDQDIKTATEILYGLKGGDKCQECCLYIDERLAQYASGAVKGQKSAMAGLVLPVTALVKKFMSLINPYVDAKKKMVPHHKKDAAGVALAASLEFFAREIISSSVEKCKAENLKRVVTTHISTTVERSPWLKDILRSYVMQGALLAASKRPAAKASKASKASKAASKASKTTKAAKASKVAKTTKAAKAVEVPETEVAEEVEASEAKAEVPSAEVEAVETSEAPSKVAKASKSASKASKASKAPSKVAKASKAASKASKAAKPSKAPKASK